ncbi:uncharacterized protein E6C27_scaffold278G00490 [Cucumis melo var. makuwa]|uniref:CACTA en-spm transposon protein n=1 Tax=Cucumis melo var. makuwa TaxID=1194695 RepID=A0A5A7T7B5_CUCMM|nr:uncharacterized protein E6C27_scaffold278G00490 [Cucumis melo var. makuwa]
MNESSTFCSCYLSGIETRFIRDGRNDDTIIEDEVIGDFKIFKQKVRPLGASSIRVISQEEKQLFHWYILNNVDETSKYRKKHLRLIRRHAQNAMNLCKRHERTFSEWFRAQMLELRESANLFDDFFSLAMGPSFDVRCYNGCIVSGLRFHTSKLDSRRTTQNSEVMVIGESDASGSGNNNFYGVLNEVLHVQYPLGRNDDLDNLAGGSSSMGDYTGAIMDEQGCTSSLKKKGKSINRVELFRETHVRVGTFVLQATEDAHSQPTPEGNQPLSRDEIYDQVLGRRSSYSKGLGWGPKSKAHKTTSSSSSTTSCSQSATEREI